MSSTAQEPPASGLPDSLTYSVPQLLGPVGLSARSLQCIVRAGFPSPAEDFQAKRIDVLKRLVKHLQATAGLLKLRAVNPIFADVTPSEGQTVEIWGVVIVSIRQFKR